MASGTPNPLNKINVLWCEICIIGGHRPEDCYLLQKNTSAPQSLYCKFCRFVVHDENSCRAYEMMINRSTYSMHSEEQGGPGVSQFNNTKGSFHKNRGGFRDHGWGKG